MSVQEYLMIFLEVHIIIGYSNRKIVLNICTSMI